MKFRMTTCFAILIISLGPIACSAQDDAVLASLQRMDEVISAELYTDSGNTRVYTIMFKQWIDHADPALGHFAQRIYLTHRDYSAPVVFRLNGYAAARNSRIELVQLLKANQIYVEHRYFGESVPEDVSWDFLSIPQSARDYHRIRETFGDLYPGKWISTGISKGGQTALFYKFYYPQDVTATVAYVAPIPREREDQRIWPYIWSRGTEECQQKIRDFQSRVLQQRDEIEPLLAELAEQRNAEFLLDIDLTLEYLVAEYPFSFWQYHKFDCSEIPGQDAEPKELLTHLEQVVSMFYYTTASYQALQPAFYQFVSQIGYYDYDVAHLGGLARHGERLDNRAFAPADAELKDDFTLANEIREYLIHRAQNVIYIYGANDPWSACALEPADSTNAFAIFHPEGDHGTSIGSLDPENRGRVITALEGWLGMDIETERRRGE